MAITEVQLIAAAIGLGIGFVLGGLVFGIWYARRASGLRTQVAVLQAQLDNRAALEDERNAALELARERLSVTFDDLADRSLQTNSSTFLRLAKENLARHQQSASNSLEAKEKAVAQLIAPVNEALLRTKQQIEAVEKDRHAAFGGVAEQLKSMGEQQRNLQNETANLVNALKRPEVRGRWGEITLKRVVELAGMVEHCDFEEQVHRQTEDGPVRPDMLVRLPENRELVIDAKTPLDAYVAAIEAKHDEDQEKQLERHTRHIRERIRELASKKYWQQFSHSPEFVVLFLPGDQFLSSALSRDPGILDDALRQKVIVATPSSLMALLKTVGHGWRQMELSENAELIRDLAEELYRRLATFTTHLAKVGQTLNQSVNAYNSAVGSLERNVLPGARKFTELGVPRKKDIAETPPIEIAPREMMSKNEDTSTPSSATDCKPADRDH